MSAVDLSNCDREPIHVPGSIQPHGALLALTLDGRLASASANAPELLGALPAPGEPLDARHASPDLRARLAQALAGSGRADAFEAALPDGRVADLAVHVHDGLLIAEAEPRRAVDLPPERFALLSHRALERIQGERDLESLLAASVEEIAALSGFERVMAYRFHPDESGEVVAERMARPMEPFLGLRYPASDIPAQARRLFVQNPVRSIPDVLYAPVPLAPDSNPTTGGPIDLSYAVLRGVSPIHVEYLSNMGVRASMSVSIVVGDRLWGLFACHHYAPHRAAPPARLTCRLLSQVVSVAVERFEAMQHAERARDAHRLVLAITARAKEDEDVVRALSSGAPAPTDLVRCAGAAVTSAAQVGVLGDAPSPEQVGEIVRALAARPVATTWATHDVARDAPELAAACAGFPGLAAIRTSAEPGCYALWFRREQVETLRWAGNPQKAATLGPHGERLSPRGSFAEWKQVVGGRAEPWHPDEIAALEELRRALFDLAADRLQETARMREMLLAMLGHDLRSPLQAITMAGEVLRIDATRAREVQKQIASISGRMGRMIAHVLDLSRMHAGMGLVGERRARDVAELLHEVAEEARGAHRDSEIVERTAGAGPALVDADRIAQVVGNLLSNARHHGTAGAPITVAAERRGDRVHVRVTNHGPAIREEALQGLFEPFKRGSLDNPANPRGLGLGLYIASSIVKEHGSTLDVSSGDGRVTFAFSLPAAD